MRCSSYSTYSTYSTYSRLAARSTSMCDCSHNNAQWEAMFAELEQYAIQWNNANAPLGEALGKWCQLQRKQHRNGQLERGRVQRLERLGFSWDSPSDISDPVRDVDWEEMCARFEAYRIEHGHGQVPKKYKKDPTLGGWVAATRRCRVSLGSARLSQLNALNFEWVSQRQCGSAFMTSFRELRSFWEQHGHTDVGRVLGERSALARWAQAQRRARKKNLLPPKRVAYLDGIGFEWSEQRCHK